jgi:hypothetical protein
VTRGRVALLGAGGALLVLASLALAVARCSAPDDASVTPIVPGPVLASAPPPDAGTDAPFVLPVSPASTPYALDGLPRTSELAAAGCPHIPLEDHVGDPIPWRPAFRITPVFAPSVRALEAVVASTAREVYGCAPTVLLSASGYRCTTVRGRPERISEHALGNAIDLRGIELDDETTITVRDHWHAHPGDDPRHARFWRLLVVHVTERAIFRGIIGPPDPDHLDHLHFDRGPSTFVDLSLE